MDKYQEVFNKYATPLPDAKIAEQVNALLEKKSRLILHLKC